MTIYNDKRLDLLYYSIILLISFTSFYYGKEYTLYHTDLIHWNFQLDAILGYINGKELYKGVFLQYGEGIVTFFNIINPFYKIDIYSLGIITNIIFSLRFILIYKISLLLTNSKPLSLIATLFIFLSMSYTQSVWPDFFAGFCLLIFLYFFISNYEKENILIKFLTAFLLFLTVYFRNTYILNFIGVSIIYLLLSIFFIKYKNNYINQIILQTFFLIIIYFLYLYLNENLFLWFSQGFGFSDHYFGVNDLSIEERIQNYSYYILRTVYYLLVPNDLPNLLFTLCVLLNIGFLLWNTIFIKNINKQTPLIIFISCYGLCGIVQTFSHYEIFRYINASISVYFVAFYIIVKFKFITEKKKLFLIIFSLIIYLFNIIGKFPLSSHKHKINNYSKDDYEISNFKYFGKKKFTKDYIKYYEDLREIICQKEHIYNLSYDKAFNFNCKKTKKTTSFSILNGDPKLIRDLQSGLNKESRVIISSEKINDLKLIYVKTFPKYFRYTLSDTYMRFIPNKLYIYE